MKSLCRPSGRVVTSWFAHVLYYKGLGLFYIVNWPEKSEKNNVLIIKILPVYEIIGGLRFPNW